MHPGYSTRMFDVHYQSPSISYFGEQTEMGSTMGTMKQKRRKKQTRLWAEFQQQHQLSDEDVGLLRQTRYPLDKLTEKLSDGIFASDTPLPERIREVHRQWQEKLQARQAAVQAGLIEPNRKKKAQLTHDPAWANAKKVCRLNTEDIRMAKELGLSPRALMKNVSSPTQQWKAPVKFWIRDLYEKRQQKAARKKVQRSAVSAESLV
jgi:hypothetical protein